MKWEAGRVVHARDCVRAGQAQSGNGHLRWDRAKQPAEEMKLAGNAVSSVDRVATRDTGRTSGRESAGREGARTPHVTIGMNTREPEITSANWGGDIHSQ